MRLCLTSDWPAERAAWLKKHISPTTVWVLALVDIDHFAETNDALGHRFGEPGHRGHVQRFRLRLVSASLRVLDSGTW